MSCGLTIACTASASAEGLAAHGNRLIVVIDGDRGDGEEACEDPSRQLVLDQPGEPE